MQFLKRQYHGSVAYVSQTLKGPDGHFSHLAFAACNKQHVMFCVEETLLFN